MLFTPLSITLSIIDISMPLRWCHCWYYFRWYIYYFQ
jgi:hypothetical protein